MNVLLIQAPLGRDQVPVYPIGLSYLAAALGDRHEVEILDANVCSRDQIGKTLERFDPEVIGFGLRNIESSQSFDHYRYFDHFPPFVRWIKSQAESATMIVGGSGFSVFPEQVMVACPDLELGIELEAEATFPRLLEKLDRPEEVRGVYYRDRNGVRFTGPAPLPDFATLPRPVRLRDLSPYQIETFQLGVQSKRGCAHRCLYCDYPYLNGNRMRLRPAADVVDELEALKQDHGIEGFFFSDGVFNEPRRHSEEICREMIRRDLGLRWSAYFSMRSFDESYLETAAAAGCELFGFAPDGLRQATLDSLDKDITEERISEVLELFRHREYPKLGLWFMFNVPEASWRDFLLVLKATLWWPLKYPSLELVGVTNMRIFPNTPLQQLARRQGMVGSDADLFQPIFYDPWPLRPLSWLLHAGRHAQHAARWFFRRQVPTGAPYRSDSVS